MVEGEIKNKTILGYISKAGALIRREKHTKDGSVMKYFSVHTNRWRFLGFYKELQKSGSGKHQAGSLSLGA